MGGNPLPVVEWSGVIFEEWSYLCGGYFFVDGWQSMVLFLIIDS